MVIATAWGVIFGAVVGAMIMVLVVWMVERRERDRKDHSPPGGGAAA